MTEEQANLAWEKKVQAEVRSLYFAELAAQYTRRKQLVTGISFSFRPARQPLCSRNCPR